jgi:hypothetical protein
MRVYSPMQSSLSLVLRPPYQEIAARPRRHPTRRQIICTLRQELATFIAWPIEAVDNIDFVRRFGPQHRPVGSNDSVVVPSNS